MCRHAIKDIIVDVMNGEILLTVSTPEYCYTVTLTNDEAKNLSSALFQVWCKRIFLEHKN